MSKAKPLATTALLPLVLFQSFWKSAARCNYSPTTMDTPNTVTKRTPTDAELANPIFAWCIANYVKSNAMVYVKGCPTEGIGAGQIRRVHSNHTAVRKA